jgi:hypothetical protein
MRAECERLDRSVRNLMKLSAPHTLPYGIADFAAGKPLLMDGLKTVTDGYASLDRVNQFEKPDQATLERGETIYLKGWAFCRTARRMQDVPTYIVMRRAGGGEEYYAPLLSRESRADVAAHFPWQRERNTRQSGFTFCARLSRLEPGSYEIGVVHVLDERCAERMFRGALRVV